MNKEEIDNILKYQEELEKKYGVRHFKMYFEDGGELDVVEYDKFLELQQENKQLKDNWNKIKEYIKSDGVSYLNFADERCFCNKKEAKYILNKMKELEGDK